MDTQKNSSPVFMPTPLLLTKAPGLDRLPLLLCSQIVSILGEEIEFRAFFVGKGMESKTGFSRQSITVGASLLWASVSIRCRKADKLKS
jgi:hypothetical protein